MICNTMAIPFATHICPSKIAIRSSRMSSRLLQGNVILHFGHAPTHIASNVYILLCRGDKEQKSRRRSRSVEPSPGPSRTAVSAPRERAMSTHDTGATPDRRRGMDLGEDSQKRIRTNSITSSTSGSNMTADEPVNPRSAAASPARSISTARKERTQTTPKRDDRDRDRDDGSKAARDRDRSDRTPRVCTLFCYFLSVVTLDPSLVCLFVCFLFVCMYDSVALTGCCRTRSSAAARVSFTTTMAPPTPTSW